mgnify:CR=1 FL=1
METPRPEPHESRTPSPNDHVRTLIELLRPAGTDLARRWLAALLVAPESVRAGIVEPVDRRIVEECGGRAPGEAGPGTHAAAETLLDIAEPPVQRDGYVEQIIRTYARRPASPGEARPGTPHSGRSAS